MQLTNITDIEIDEYDFNDDLLFKGKDRTFFKKDDAAYITSEIFCSILTIIGNALVLLVYWHEQRKNVSHKIIHKYVISMALADFLMGVTGIPTAILVSVGLPRQRFLCLAALSIQTWFGMVSVLALVAASTAKYLSLAHPIWFSTKFTHMWANVHIFIHWVIGTVVGWLPSLGLNNAPKQTKILYRNLTEDDNFEWTVDSDVKNECSSNSTHMCYREEFMCYFNDIMPKQMSLVLMFGVIVPSCLILIFIYFRIYLIIKGTINRSRKSSEDDSNVDWIQILCSLFNGCCTTQTGPRKIGDLKTREVQTAFVLLVTVLFFAICWLPLYIVDVMFSLAPQSLSISIETINALIVLRHFNSVLNPFLYAYHMRGFKKSLKEIFVKWFCREKIDWTRPSMVASTSDESSRIRTEALRVSEKI
uniref:CSON006764 protein n=1 Tax=Culicoides sonorensis TaxID=179676 RepID=A0A336LC14_CULSO